MARLRNGILGPLIGKLANLVGYERLGRPVVRMAPRKTKKKKPRSEAQKAVNLRFKIVKSFIAEVGEFIHIGFRQEVAGTTKIPENGAVSYHLNHAITGEYPDLSLDYSKVMLCKGKLPGPLNASVELHENILKFKWDEDKTLSSKQRRDQVMMLAYLPANKHADYRLSGARRQEGADEIPIRIHKQSRGQYIKDEFVEVYLAFVSDDRKSVSDSVYMGRIAV